MTPNAEFLNKLMALLGDDFPRYEKVMNDTPCRAFHVNTLIPGWKELALHGDIFGAKISYTDNGYIYSGEEGVGFSPIHHAGLIYMQEPSAMIPVASCDFRGDERILDLCAAPGGKSSQIAIKLGGRGVLFANEIVPDRANVLARNMERMGYENVVVTRNSSRDYAELMPGFFDFVFVDAPCSGEGMMRKEPEAVRQWSPQLVKSCAERQRHILDNAHKALKSGGTLVYSTCTFSVEENEEIVSYLVNRYGYEAEDMPSATVENTSPGIESECHGFDFRRIRRFYPFSGLGEGQASVKLRKPDDCRATEHRFKNARVKSDKIVEEFIYRNTSLDHPVICFDGKYFYLPAFGYDCGLNVVFDGVRLGSVDGKRFIPHHHFFSALNEVFNERIELDEVAAMEYLHGDELDCNASGWGVFEYLGAGLGGFKASGGKAKNHYPKGLRNLK